MILMFKRFILTAGWFTLACIWVSLAFVGWTVWTPGRRLVVTPLPFVVDQPVVKVGSNLSYAVSYCIESPLPLAITADRELEREGSQAVFPISPPVTYLIDKPCETRRFYLPISSFIPPGHYRVRWYTTLQPNMIRVTRQTFLSASFEVVK